MLCSDAERRAMPNVVNPVHPQECIWLHVHRHPLLARSLLLCAVRPCCSEGHAFCVDLLIAHPWLLCHPLLAPALLPCAVQAMLLRGPRLLLSTLCILGCPSPSSVYPFSAVLHSDAVQRDVPYVVDLVHSQMFVFMSY